MMDAFAVSPRQVEHASAEASTRPRHRARWTGLIDSCRAAAATLSASRRQQAPSQQA